MKFSKLPGYIKFIFIVSLIAYIWYLISVLLLPLAEITGKENIFFSALYNIVNFPLSLLGFVFCISFLATILMFMRFAKEDSYTRFVILEGITFTLYFLIPVISTILILVFIIGSVSGFIPTPEKIAAFLEDVFIFNAILFLMTALFNITPYIILKREKSFKHS